MKQTKFRWKPSAALLLSLVCLLTVVGVTPVRAAEDTATREYAIAAFIEAIGMETLEGSPDALAAFTDADQIGEQYAEAMAKAVAGGIVIGNGDGTLRPKGMIRRIEALNRSLGIPAKLPGIRPEDIEMLARRADREGNPLYPVPRLMDARELQKFYVMVAEDLNGAEQEG